MILLALGAIGDYVARTYEETKGRPLYVVTDMRNLPEFRGVLTRAVILADGGPRVPVTLDEGAGSRSRTEEISSYRPLAGVRG
jgi:hypothetical protein